MSRPSGVAVMARKKTLLLLPELSCQMIQEQNFPPLVEAAGSEATSFDWEECQPRYQQMRKQFSYLLSSSVAPSTFLRTSTVSSDRRASVMSSRGFSGPKTSLTA